MGCQLNFKSAHLFKDLNMKSALSRFSKTCYGRLANHDDEYCVLETGTSLSRWRERGGVRVEFVIAPPSSLSSSQGERSSEECIFKFKECTFEKFLTEKIWAFRRVFLDAAKEILTYP
jgi:hypothetical protein